MLIGFLTILIGLAGTGVLFVYWRKHYPYKRLAIFCGWALLLMSLGFWVIFSGVEFGVVFGLMMPALYAWALTLLSSKAKPSDRTRLQCYQTKWPKLAHMLRHMLQNSGWFLLIIPVLALSSTLISIAFMYLLPIQDVNRMAICVFLMPAVWGVAIVWLLIDKHTLRPLTTNFTLCVFSTLYLFL